MNPPTIAVVHFAWCHKFPEDAARDALERFSSFVTEWDAGARRTESLFARCESPVERLFLLGWMLEQDLDLLSVPIPGCGFLGEPNGPQRVIEVQPTLETTKGPRRPDFRVGYRDANGLSLVYVEIDGHEFHQSTRWQVARDRQRERAIAEGGDVVIRYTGGEVTRDPQGCAVEAVRIARALAKRRAA